MEYSLLLSQTLYNAVFMLALAKLYVERLAQRLELMIAAFYVAHPSMRFTQMNFKSMKKKFSKSIHLSRFLLIILTAFLGWHIGAPQVFAQIGSVTSIHDPSIIESDNVFYLFSTGRGLPIHSSVDLFNWKRAGRAIDQAPAWTRVYAPAGTSMWAPDISKFKGEFRLYYAVSRFGTTSSAIGLLTNATLNPASPDYKWNDRGKVIDTPDNNDWNAIDPCVVEDADGNPWLVLGSCWSGIKLVPLDGKTGLLSDLTVKPIALATHPPTNIIEEGYIRRHGDWYYLWESVDHCCRGASSDYRILVGRSKTIRGPYLDRDARPMTEGGGTLVLLSHDNVRGPGSCAIVQCANHDYLVHHEYDAANAGTPTLQIRQLFWAEDGWPVAGEPITHSPRDKIPASKPIAGDWTIRYDYGPQRTITLRDDGSVVPMRGRWNCNGDTLTLSWFEAAKTLEESCSLAEDGTYFTGRNADGKIITGMRKTPAAR